MPCAEHLRPSLSEEQATRYQPIKDAVAEILEGSVGGPDRDRVFSEVGEFVGHALGFLNEQDLGPTFTSEELERLRDDHDLVCVLLNRSGSTNTIRWEIKEEILPALEALYKGTATQEQRQHISNFFK